MVHRIIGYYVSKPHAYSFFSLINISKVFFLDLGQAASADRAVPNNYILQIHGRTPLTTYATQVSLKASSLNTNDCFILVQAQRYS